MAKPIVSIIMGSQSDWEVVKPASNILDEFKITHECKIISAHRTTKRHSDFCKNAKMRGIFFRALGGGQPNKIKISSIIIKVWNFFIMISIKF